MRRKVPPLKGEVAQSAGGVLLAAESAGVTPQSPSVTAPLSGEPYRVPERGSSACTEKMPPLKGEVAQSAGGVHKGVRTKEVPKCNANFSLATIPA